MTWRRRCTRARNLQRAGLYLLLAAGCQRQHIEAKAKAAARAKRWASSLHPSSSKAIALGEPDGLIKTVFDAKTGELLGAHMVGAEVTELIQGYVVAKTGGQ
ncbi:MAG: hypothetical protein H6924_03485 [Alphaproteobacteria bacterium]|nr:hypothetical protein [Alphaproteobacteria bacterium]